MWTVVTMVSQTKFDRELRALLTDGAVHNPCKMLLFRERTIIDNIDLACLKQNEEKQSGLVLSPSLYTTLGVLVMKHSKR